VDKPSRKIDKYSVIVRHELGPRQLRALLLLLVILPLSPTVLMFRYMVETVRNQHTAGDETLADEQITAYGWAVAGVALVNVMVSGAAAIALHRQSRLRELQSSALATVAHELKTPLASMRLLTDTLLETPDPDPERSRSYIHLIATENDRLIRLTENFLTLSRFETESGLDRRSPIEPAVLARAAIASLESRFKDAGIQPEATFDEPLPTVTVNRESTVVVLVNLLDNALKYSDPGKPIALHIRASDGTVDFIVEDHGIGIAAEAQPHIFDCFFQADQKLARTREGCGLGLHIARSIVQAHGGAITVRSAPGKGSTFCVTLPATKGALGA
jgi:signal transduction histidine kinase